MGRETGVKPEVRYVDGEGGRRETKGTYEGKLEKGRGK